MTWTCVSCGFLARPAKEDLQGKEWGCFAGAYKAWWTKLEKPKKPLVNVKHMESGNRYKWPIWPKFLDREWKVIREKIESEVITNKLFLSGLTQKGNWVKAVGTRVIFVVTVVTSEKGTSWKVGSCLLQVCRWRALAGQFYGKNTFLCFTYGKEK